MPEDGYTSNLDDLEQWENGAIGGWDFGTIADDIASEVAAGIRERAFERGLDVDGQPLKDNEPRYAAAKARKFGSTQPLVRTGQLLSIESLKGEIEAGADSITMTYGENEAGEEGGATDRQKAGWVSGDRPFYALDDSIIDERIMPIVGDSLDRRLEG